MVNVVIFGNNTTPISLEQFIEEVDIDLEIRRKIRHLARHCNNDQVIFYCPRCGVVACIYRDSIEYIFEKHSNFHRQIGI